MTFNESFDRQAKELLGDLAKLLERREWTAGQTESEEVRIAIREIRLAVVELASGIANE